MEKAKNDPDWDEAVPYEKKVRGKVFEKKKIEPTVVEKNELSELGFDVEFDESITEVCCCCCCFDLSEVTCY